jgi:hypothetical protein
VWIHVKAACSLLWLAVMLTGTARAADAKTDAAEAAAAMERAKRQAASPLRVILEASKVRRKVVVEPEPSVPESADAAGLRRVAARPAGSPEARAAATPALVPLLASSRQFPAVPREEDPAPAPHRQPALLTMPNLPLAEARSVVAVPAMQAQNTAGELPTAASLDLPSAPSVADMQMRPRLINMVEPEIPPRVLEEIGRLFEVEVDVTIRGDGSVSAVKVLPSAPRQVARYVAAAVERWRFDAASGERRHRVQLVFNAQ